MLDKYFGFLRVEDIDAIIEALVNQCRVDSKEIELLVSMISDMVSHSAENVQAQYEEIQTLYKTSQQSFVEVSDSIVQADFDYQKQYDLLRLHQRIDHISTYIMSLAKRILICARMDVDVPDEMKALLSDICSSLKHIYDTYIEALDLYVGGNKGLIDLVHSIEDMYHEIENQLSDGLALVYEAANRGDLPVGSVMVIKDMMEKIEQLSDAIKEAAMSLDWLLMS